MAESGMPRCPRCGGELIRYMDEATGDFWVACEEADCDYERPDD
jgi:ssDNA-binding Zn-finger/Zn-ribbon topoisomerase 1